MCQGRFVTVCMSHFGMTNSRPYAMSHWDCGQFSPNVHENFEKFKIISTPTGSWVPLRQRRDRIQLPVGVEKLAWIFQNFQDFQDFFKISMNIGTLWMGQSIHTLTPLHTLDGTEYKRLLQSKVFSWSKKVRFISRLVLENEMQQYESDWITLFRDWNISPIYPLYISSVAILVGLRYLSMKVSPVPLLQMPVRSELILRPHILPLGCWVYLTTVMSEIRKVVTKDSSDSPP